MLKRLISGLGAFVINAVADNIEIMEELGNIEIIPGRYGEFIA